MGNLILCHKKHAVTPYEVTRIHRKIYTLEELCYYLCNNIYLIDYTIMNEQLCRWMDEELELKELAQTLRDLIRVRSSIEKFVLTILTEAKIYGETEMIRIQNVLERLKNQKDIERQKFKGDNLLESREWEEAILVYQSILNQPKDESVDEKFYGRIYANMGSAYGKLFLCQESAKMFDRAYKLCQDEELLLPYLYASYRYMSMEEYHILITKNPAFAEVNAKMRQICDEVRSGLVMEENPQQLEEWKYQYRRSHI